MRLKNVVLVCLLGSLWIAGCGGDDKKSGGGGSYSDISDSVANPTGTLESSNAKSVADEYAKIASPSAGGERIAASDYDQTINCTASGTQTISASGNGNSGTTVLTYDNCCYTAGCCYNGGGNWYYSGATSGATFSYCGSYDIDYDCGGTYSLSYSGCFGTDGWTYVVEISGETFAVSGTYSNGNGTLKIKGANGSYSCSYTGGTGSCTGDSGNFSF